MSTMDKVMLSERNKSIFLIDEYKFRFHKHLSKNHQPGIIVAKSFFKLNEFITIKLRNL